mmetsp:Transcript_6416/g.13330  ORF Transcript_6416/g.13330 Transcript_6416/m.13330 type:complete len:521 (+) Transcript_6416:56-1618(+)|eukprot:CAMPEP_0197546148 /NCGR_PEP_ID=MMETSP1320-20131121/879_1 /TAXON_ID=91990 /ORGANISM="Bolidomonas sp., Strain RCC2347" /LENGTH=520 /DNA_ID=CAMNT_0043105697 /DNA_START=45 /DNA_END=1607 /DNA_ORIENTATION=+
MDWVEYVRDQAILAKEIYRNPKLLWTDPDKFEKSESNGAQAAHESESKEQAEKKTTVDYFSSLEESIEAVNELKYYGLPGTSNSRIRNLIAYVTAKHPLLAIVLASPYDYYTRKRRVAALIGSLGLSLSMFMFFYFVFSEYALITCNSGCDVVVPCNRTHLTRQLDTFWEDGSMCCQDNCVLWLDDLDKSQYEFIPDYCQGESYSYDLEQIGQLEELPPYETHRTEVTVSLWEFSCDGGTQSLGSLEYLILSSALYPLDVFLGYISTWGTKNPNKYWNKGTKAVWQFMGSLISYGWSLIMILFTCINVSSTLASDNYLQIENEGNGRQVRLFASGFRLLWYSWILWLLKNIPSHCVFYFIKKKQFKEKYPDLVSIEPSEFDETTQPVKTTHPDKTTLDCVSSQSSHPQTYELVPRNGIQPQGALLGSQALLTLDDIMRPAPPQVPPQATPQALPHFPPQPQPQLQPQVAAIKQPRAFSVTVPPNCPPGSMIMFTPPDSQLAFSCQVPHGANQGDVFQVII